MMTLEKNNVTEHLVTTALIWVLENYNKHSMDYIECAVKHWKIIDKKLE